MRDRKKDGACLPRRGQESSITARSQHSLSSLSILLYSAAVFFFCVCFQFSQGLLLLLYSLQPSPPTQKKPKPPTQKERESFYGLLFPVGTISSPQSQACILCLRGSEFHKGPVLWQPVVGMTQRSSQNSRHCHQPLRDPRKQKCREFERLGKREKLCWRTRTHSLVHNLLYTEILSDP